MTDVDAAPGPTTLEALEPTDASEPPTRSRRRRALLVAGGILVLALAGTVTWLVVDHQRTAAAITAATADLETHRSELVVAQSELASDLADAEGTLTGSEGRVDDDAVRTELEDVIANGTGLVAPLDLIGPAASDLDMLTIQDAFVLSHTNDVARHSLALAAAAASVDDAVAAWELAQAGAALDTATSTLATLIETAGATLSATEGQVADEQVRIALAAAIDSASTTLGVVVDRADLDVVRSAAASATGATEGLDAAHLSAQDAHTAWMAQREAELAAAAAASQAEKNSSRSPMSAGTTNFPSSRTSSQSATTSPTNLAPAAPSTGTGATPPVAAPQAEEWVESTTQEDVTWCLDTSGNAWRC